MFQNKKGRKMKLFLLGLRGRRPNKEFSPETTLFRYIVFLLYVILFYQLEAKSQEEAENLLSLAGLVFAATVAILLLTLVWVKTKSFVFNTIVSSKATVGKDSFGDYVLGSVFGTILFIFSAIIIGIIAKGMNQNFF